MRVILLNIIWINYVVYFLGDKINSNKTKLSVYFWSTSEQSKKKHIPQNMKNVLL